MVLNKNKVIESDAHILTHMMQMPSKLIPWTRWKWVMPASLSMMAPLPPLWERSSGFSGSSTHQAPRRGGHPEWSHWSFPYYDPPTHTHAHTHIYIPSLSLTPTHTLPSRYPVLHILYSPQSWHLTATRSHPTPRTPYPYLVHTLTLYPTHIPIPYPIHTFTPSYTPSCQTPILLYAIPHTH